MPREEFEPTISTFERAKTVHASDRSSTVIGIQTVNIFDRRRNTRIVINIIILATKEEVYFEGSRTVNISEIFELKVLTAVVRKSSISWDITPCKR
jgi:hypothetical protein